MVEECFRKKVQMKEPVKQEDSGNKNKTKGRRTKEEMNRPQGART